MKKMISSLALVSAFAAHSYAAPAVQVRLPERFRLLTGQLFDLRVEATGLTNPATASIQVLVNGAPATLPTPEVTTDNDVNPADGDEAWTYRATSFPAEGVQTVQVTVTDSSGTGNATQRIGVQRFSFGPNGTLPKKNIILYIGDAMGTAYRDAGRLVAKSTGNRFREGFFDQWQEMDQMPVTGMVMTYALDRVVPDSANTATAWASGNKTVDGTLNVLPDNNDFKFNASNATLQSTKQYALDNPRVETLWQYLKRLYGYKTGIVSTADITDATPGGEGGYSLLRSLTFDIARQYADGVWTAGPEFDVILGGGLEHFNQRNATNSGDTRDLTAELQASGFTYVTNRSALNALATPPDKLLGLFYAAPAPVANTGASGNMNVAYDKLGLARPTDEPGSNSATNTPNFNGFTDQPFLDEMTTRAIATLNKNGGPFILMVEGASIDKQSHPNHEAGVIWDVIEFDKAIGVGRTFAKSNSGKTLVLTTADHDQSMSIVGVTDTTLAGAVLNTRSLSLYPRTKTAYDPMLTSTTPGPSVGAAGVAPSNSGNNAGEVTGFPNYSEATFSGGVYPDNANRFKLAVGFRTGNHTGSSVPITAEGPGALLFAGYFDQTDIFFKMSRALSSDTSPLDEFTKAR
ncbi:MAG: alkaline phosphatase, partial [Verrucomicrobiota bacterium]|nr:alkaline phosphatase [Verrucomicrobiota bacterium]